ncbi:MAG: hypothetical protein F4103_06400, partial [Boseongicola sp. SB0673_bin_14]|nr:hypothetical protein [Boseongicola sp. SB0673_bin_14]
MNVTACCILTMTPALADEAQDIALAESLISEIKRHIKADKRAFERATDALSKTEEGKSRMATCRSRNTSFWRLCMAKDWKFDGAYEPLYEQFYDEE